VTGTSNASGGAAHLQAARRTPNVATLLLLVAALAMFAYHASFYWDWTEDDAFISLRYAQNLAAGHGLAFNPGERVEGYSNFTWVLLAAGAIGVGTDPLLTVKTCGLLAGLGCLLLAWALVLRLAPRAGMLSILAPWYLAISPVLTHHSISGLESSFFAFLLIASIYVACDPRPPGTVSKTLLVLLLVLLSMTRPEGAGLAFVILLIRGLVQPASGGRPPATGWAQRLVASLRSSRAEWAAYLLIFGAWFVWRWNYFGLLLPNTFYAKGQGGLHSIIDGIQYSLDFLRDGGGPMFFGVSLAPLVLGNMRPATWMAFGVLVVYLLFVVVAGGDWMWNYRFFAHVLPILAALVTAGGALILARFGERSWQTLGAYAVLSLLLLTTFVGMGNTELRMARTILPAIRSHNYLSQNYEEIGLWLKENTPAGARIAISDVGAVAYFSERHIVDMFGLNDRHIASIKGRMHYKTDPQYVLEQEPDYIILVSLNDQGGGYSFQRVPDYAMNALPEFQEKYELIRTVPQHWNNEFALIYKRQPIDPEERPQ